MWYETSFARMLIDNHITEQDPEAMRNFSPEEYVAMIKRARIDSSMVYACCHNGNSYYPTKVGHMHAGLEGRDIFGQTVDLLRKEGITPVAYHSASFDNWTAQKHPEWRMEDAIGQQTGRRYWYSCPNHPEYEEYARQQIAEIVSYDVAGIFIDMTFWPLICTCRSCREKHLKMFGRDIPDTLDWSNPDWVKFQRFREQSLDRFAASLTAKCREVRPEMSVVHQFSPGLVGWHLGQTSGIHKACDYASGDFYGDQTFHRVGQKIMRAFSQNLPIEFMTSRCVNLRDHTSRKSEDEMVCSAATSYAGGGACFLIDAINVDGSLHKPTFARIGSVMDRLAPFRKRLTELRPDLVADTGLYYSTFSCVNYDSNGTSLRNLAGATTHMQSKGELPTLIEMHNTSIVLNQANIPYKSIVDTTTDYSGLKNLIVNNCMFLSEDEVARIRKFVEAGGTLIATGLTSLYDLEGKTTGDFALADVFGVSYTGEMSKSVNFLVADWWEDMVLCERAAPFVKATTAQSLAKVAEPLFEPWHPTKYTAIHSNPPGPITDYDALTVNTTFGKGKCVYLYSSLRSMRQDAQQIFGKHLLKEHAPSGMVLESNAPVPVEITFTKSLVQANTWLFNLVNYQHELPNIPVHDIKTTFRLPGGFVPKSCKCVESGQDMPFTVDDDAVTIGVPRLETIVMIEMT